MSLQINSKFHPKFKTILKNSTIGVIFVLFGSPSLALGFNFDEISKNSFIWKVVKPLRAVSPGEYEETVQLIGVLPTGGQAICTGTVIGSHTILTAAHCACDLGKDIKVKIDSLASASTTIDEQRLHGVSCDTYTSASTSQKHKYLAEKGDIALFITHDLLKVSPAVAVESDLGPSKYLVVGYGSSYEPGLHEKWLGKINLEFCSEFNQVEYGCNPKSEFFGLGEADKSEVHTDTCQGDSGGPVFIGDSKKLIGVTSRSALGKSCGQGGLYVKINKELLSWITQFNI